MYIIVTRAWADPAVRGKNAPLRASLCPTNPAAGTLTLLQRACLFPHVFSAEVLPRRRPTL